MSKKLSKKAKQKDALSDGKRALEVLDETREKIKRYEAKEIRDLQSAAFELYDILEAFK